MYLIVENKLQDFRERCLQRGYPAPITRYKIDFLKYAYELPSLTVREMRQLDRSHVKDDNLFKITVVVGTILLSRDSLRGFQVPAAVDEMLALMTEHYFPAQVA